MKPSVGRIVHYVARGSADGRFPSGCRAAVVTERREPCRTCDGPTRETVGMVCQACGRDFAPEPERVE